MSIKFKLSLLLCSIFAMALSSHSSASSFYIKVSSCWMDYSTMHDTCQVRFKVNAGGTNLREGDATESHTNVVRAAVSLGSGHHFNSQDYSLACGDNKAVSNTIKLTVETEFMRNTVGAKIECTKRSAGQQDDSAGSDEPEIPNHTCNKKRCGKKVRWADDWSGGRRR